MVELVGQEHAVVRFTTELGEIKSSASDQPEVFFAAISVRHSQRVNWGCTPTSSRSARARASFSEAPLFEASHGQPEGIDP